MLLSAMISESMSWHCLIVVSIHSMIIPCSRSFSGCIKTRAVGFLLVRPLCFLNDALGRVDGNVGLKIEQNLKMSIARKTTPKYEHFQNFCLIIIQCI